MYNANFVHKGRGVHTGRGINTKRGREGEEQAAAALEKAGMEIIAKNFRSKYGEIDIIALAGETIVFVEVKSWSTYGMEDLQYGLNIRKQQKIIKTAKYFLCENRKYSRMAIRFDVVFVKNNSITHLASAFTERVL
ncbi:MAG: YraN family protein [Treponema sp.]|jgi:putative endonuclease|nr:YraN family protein [Treponema sp.]